jgi:hypothetical protein
MSIHHGFDDPYEVPDDYTGEDEVEDYIRWQRWHDEHCTDHHGHRMVFETPDVKTVVTIDPGRYL